MDSLELKQPLSALVSKVKELHGVTSIGMQFVLTKIAVKHISFIANNKFEIPSPLTSQGETIANGSTAIDLNQMIQELFVLKLEAENTVIMPMDLFTEFKLQKYFEFSDLQVKTFQFMMTMTQSANGKEIVYSENKLMKYLSMMMSTTQPPSFSTNLYYRMYECRRIQKKILLIRHVLSDESMSLFPDFQRRVSLLGQLGYLDATCKVITSKGRVCCELNTCDELLGTEILFNNILEPLTPEEAVAMLSALVFQEKNEVDDLLTPNMEEAKAGMQLIFELLKTAQDVDKIENDPDAKPILNFGLCSVVFKWAKGVPFKEITLETEFQEGSIVRAITRLDELCRDVMKAAVVMGNPALYRKMETASKLIKRDIVFAGSLYIQ
jgi:superfamily II RNA helicase